MIKRFGFYYHPQKSPVILIGLFCLLSMISGCWRETDPSDVTILFWTALSEKNWDEAKEYSVEGSEALFDKTQGYGYLQTGNVVINYDNATVETMISRKTAAKGHSFITYLVRVKQSDLWKVDYARTKAEIKQREFKDALKIIQQLSSAVKITVKQKMSLIKNKAISLFVTVKKWFKKQTKKWFK
ncbi:MAG: hypothetical protein Q9M50_03620 [Methylococcales bacterium]|nr:hypothetical protein [Methylococcales bacterium]